MTMAPYYRSRNLFKQNVRYRTLMSHQKREHKNIINFNYGEKCFYGRMNYTQVAIALARPGRAHATLIGIKNAQEGSTITALNFVAEAFDEMARHFEKCAQAGLIRGGEKYLSKLVAYKAYEDPMIKYSELQDAFAATIKKKFRANKAQFVDIHGFLPQFLQLIEKPLTRIPITYPGLLKSRLCTTMNTGLAIEIADVDCSDDVSKINDFVKSPNWKFFVNACNRFGFLIDENVPWRIVADVSPAAMRARESKYNILPTSALFNIVYNPAGLIYYTRMLDDILAMYNATRRKLVEVEQVCNGKITRRRVSPMRYTVTDLAKEIPAAPRVAIYCALRIAESQPELSQVARRQIIDDCLEMYRANGMIGDTLNHFEEFIAKTFDKVGSYSYINRTMPLKVASAKARDPRNLGRTLISNSETESDISNY